MNHAQIQSLAALMFCNSLMVKVAKQGHDCPNWKYHQSKNAAGKGLEAHPEKTSFIIVGWC